MYKLIAVAVISLFLMVSTFLFLPKSRKIKKEKPKTSIQNTENKPIVENENTKPIVTSFKSDKQKSRKRNERHFVPFTKEEHDRLIDNLKVKTTSLLNVRKERKQRAEMSVNEDE